MKSKPTTSPRERILATAADLFYKHGIHAVGIDRIIRESDVAKMTFYKYFPSKSSLIASYLSHKNTLWLDMLNKFTSGPEMTAIDRVLAIFDVLYLSFQDPGFQGCPFTKALAEFGSTQGETEIQAEILAHFSTTEALASQLIAELDLARPQAVLQTVISLISGSIIVAQVSRRADVAQINKEAARLLLLQASSNDNHSVRTRRKHKQPVPRRSLRRK